MVDRLSILKIHFWVDMRQKIATFAGGCFWCLQHDLEGVEGVLATTSGYTGGKTPNPTYEEVCTGRTGHVEAVEVVYDPSIITFGQLLERYWHSIDPTRDDGQFSDKGPQYRPVIFFHDAEQKGVAEASKKELIQSGKCARVLVAIEPAQTFYAAEEYHQKYDQKNPARYQFYSCNSGRGQRLKELWGRL